LKGLVLYPGLICIKNGSPLLIYNNSRVVINIIGEKRINKIREPTKSINLFKKK
jgi:hypothetical protein